MIWVAVFPWAVIVNTEKGKIYGAKLATWFMTTPTNYRMSLWVEKR